MKLYLDANVAIALVLEEENSARARTLLAGAEGLILSDFARAECVSSLGRFVRTGRLSDRAARRTIAALDALGAQCGQCVLDPLDLAQAEGWMRSLTLRLRTPDALHLALTLRCGARLATMDRALAGDAATLGIPLAA